MSQLDKWQFREFYYNDREKVIQILTSEIIFLDHCLSKVKKRKEKKIIKKSYRKLERLLTIQIEQMYVKMSENDYEKISSSIVQVFNNAINKLS